MSQYSQNAMNSKNVLWLVIVFSTLIYFQRCQVQKFSKLEYFALKLYHKEVTESQMTQFFSDPKLVLKALGFIVSPGKETLNFDVYLQNTF